jgi:hypothetical protein
MGIFKSFTKVLKKAAPIIGGAIGFGIGGGALGAALGSGIGSLIGGGDTEDALKAAALGGIAGYAGGKFFGPSTASNSGFVTGPEIMTTSASTAPVSAIKSAGSSGMMSALKDFATSPVGIASIVGAGGLAALGGEEVDTTTSSQPPYPEGKTRLGYGRIGDKFYNLDDDDERKQYFEDLRNRNKDDDEVVTMSSGGLNLLGETINRGLHNEIKGRADQIQPFLDQVGDMAQDKFGVDVTAGSGLGGGLGFPSQLPGLGGGLGMPNANQLGNRLPAFTDDMANRLFEAGKNQMGSNAYAPSGNSRSDIRAAYMPIDQGDGIDQFGKSMETTGSTTVPKDPGKALELLGNAFNRGVSTVGSSPFGSGQSRLGGLGAIGSLFMNDGGEVNGPGTGTSDSVPARLSDGEFVLTAKAVRGAGGGDRDLGAARMYDMMSELERVA